MEVAAVAEASSNDRRVKLASFSLRHDDFVHDVQFDHYGKRIATCSSDQIIKIWERAADLNFADTSVDPNVGVNASGDKIGFHSHNNNDPVSEMMLTNEWVCTYQIQENHNGAIQRVAWADPDFGQIIASCGMDQQVFIYKEKDQQNVPRRNNNSANRTDVVHTGRVWEQVLPLVINKAIRDIKFAPKSFGPVLAVADAEGSISFFTKSQDNDKSWDEKIRSIKQRVSPCNCLAWNPAFDEPPMLLCGYEEQKSQSAAANQEQDPTQSQLVLYKYERLSQEFTQYGQFEGRQGHSGSIHDIAWAPLAGRSFHLIATSATDKKVVIWRLQVTDLLSDRPDEIFDEPRVVPIKVLVEPTEAIYSPDYLRLKWNVTGTCIAGSAVDGTVSVWQRTLHPEGGYVKIAGIQSR